MRKIIFTRGLPGAGKSIYLNNNGLMPYTISADDIRLLFTSPAQNIEGSLTIDQGHDSKVWDFLMTKLEERMIHGDLTVVDATHCRKGDFDKYRKLIDQYKYRAFCVDFGSIPLATCLEHNQGRAEYKIVPEEVIFRMNNNLALSNVPSWITAAELTQNIWEMINPPTLDFDQYDKIVHFGDLQGCYTPLAQYFETNPFDPNTMYIFVGDLVDRGTENAEVVEFMLGIYNLPNVLIVEGNHEAYLQDWANGLPVKTREFTNNTQVQLEEARVSTKEVRQLCRKLRQMVDYSYHGKRVLVTHGGLAKIPQCMVQIKTLQLIKGVGVYDEHSKVDLAFYNNHKSDNCYSIHGHRNSNCDPTEVNPNVYNLEGKVEFGGELRVVELTKKGFEINNISNSKAGAEGINEVTFPENEVFIHNLKENSLIKEKLLPDNIASYNFTNKVFYDKKWDAQNIKARGLFLNTKSFEIVARSYNKFFNIDEMPSTRIENLANTLVFPVKCYHKYNGFLGILGYDTMTDQLIFASKSTTTSDFAGWLQDIFDKIVDKAHAQKLKELIRDQNLTLVFEVIDVINDPHIVKYPNNSIRLLDAVRRTQEFSKLLDQEVINIANDFGFEFKVTELVLENSDQLMELYNQSKVIDDVFQEDFIEGYVLEDSIGFLTKLKLPLYSFWKHIRSQKEYLCSGKSIKPSQNNSKTPNYNQILTILGTLTKEELSLDVIKVKDVIKNRFFS